MGHRRKAFIPFCFMLLPLCLCFSTGCDELEEVPETPESITISGVLTSMPFMTRVAGATVAVEAQGVSTTTAEDGSWALEVSPGVDPVIKVTSPTGDFRPAYNGIPVSVGIYSMDLQVIAPWFYNLLVNSIDADPDRACVMLGAAAAFASLDPQEMVTLEGVTVFVEPADEVVLTYLSNIGLPSSSMTETGTLGVFIILVPDATVTTHIDISGAKTGATLMGVANQPTYPGSYVPVGLIDPFYVP